MVFSKIHEDYEGFFSSNCVFFIIILCSPLSNARHLPGHIAIPPCGCEMDVEIRPDGSVWHPSEAIWLDHSVVHDNRAVEESYDIETLPRAACKRIKFKSKIDFVKGKSKKIFAHLPKPSQSATGPIFTDVSTYVKNWYFRHPYACSDTPPGPDLLAKLILYYDNNRNNLNWGIHLTKPPPIYCGSSILGLGHV